MKILNMNLLFLNYGAEPSRTFLYFILNINNATIIFYRGIIIVPTIQN
ncbi:hypothetical protein [Lysinibacillus xylanilyticus]